MAYHRVLAQANDRPGLLVMASLFVVIAILSTGMRFYARRLTRSKLSHDDWIALTSAKILVLGLNAIFIAATAAGAITGHSPVVDDWPISTPLEHLVEKYKYGFQILEKPTFALIKISILFLWMRFFGHVQSFRVTCWVMIAVVSLWGFAFLFATIFQCGLNWEWNWAPITLFLTQCSNTLDMLTVFCATDVLTDFIILVMPIPMIWSLQIEPKRKAGVSALFMVGLFTIGAGIARMYIYLVTSYDKENNPDFIADFTLFILWSEIEVNVALLVCHMPTLVPVIAKIRDGVVSLTHSASESHLLSSITSKWRSTKGSTQSSSSFDSSYDSHNESTTNLNKGPLRKDQLSCTRSLVQTSISHSDIDQDLEKQIRGMEGVYVRTEITHQTGL